MNSRQSLYVMALHGGLAASIVIAATILGFHGTLDASAVTAIFGAALGFAGGIGSALGSLGAVVNGKDVVAPAAMSKREDTLQQALGALTNTAVPPESPSAGRSPGGAD